MKIKFLKIESRKCTGGIDKKERTDSAVLLYSWKFPKISLLTTILYFLKPQYLKEMIYLSIHTNFTMKKYIDRE